MVVFPVCKINKREKEGVANYFHWRRVAEFAIASADMQRTQSYVERGRQFKDVTADLAAQRSRN